MLHFLVADMLYVFDLDPNGYGKSFEVKYRTVKQTSAQMCTAHASMRQAYPGTCKPCSVVHLNDNAYTLVETLVGENHCNATVLHREGAERVPVPGRPTITSCLCHQRKEPKLITALAGRQRQEPA